MNSRDALAKRVMGAAIDLHHELTAAGANDLLLLDDVRVDLTEDGCRVIFVESKPVKKAKDDDAKN